MMFVNPIPTSVALPLVVRGRITSPNNVRTRSVRRTYVRTYTSRACVDRVRVWRGEGVYPLFSLLKLLLLV